MKIESIKPGRRDREKLVIRTECGRYIPAYIDDAYKLSAGDELTEREAEELERRYAAYSARKSAARSLAKRNMSHSELSKKLRERGFSEDASEKTAAWFEERGLIDDESYAAMLMREYSRRGYGIMRIREELRRRGISKEISENLLEEYEGGESEIIKLIEKKLGGRAPDADEKRKLIAFLSRRGFKFDEIRSAMAEMQFNTEDMSDG